MAAAATYDLGLCTSWGLQPLIGLVNWQPVQYTAVHADGTVPRQSDRYMESSYIILRKDVT